MTEKELRKLKRSDFLQLLLAQTKDMTELQARLDETVQTLEQSRAEIESLNARLNEKDELIAGFKGRMDKKEATIRTLKQEIEDLKSILKALGGTEPSKAVSGGAQGESEKENRRKKRHKH